MTISYSGGRHELGQNFLVNAQLIEQIVALVGGCTGPIVEIGAGSGALTVPLGALGRPLTAVEIDPRQSARLRARVPRNVEVVTDDIRRYTFPRHRHVVVGNIPFHLTTMILRRLLAHSEWQHAFIVVQWEVARRRAGVGGATLLTALWWPWYEFALVRRIPARSFRPVPSVDAGLLRMDRRAEPLVLERAPYQRFVTEIFTGRGRGLVGILRANGRLSPSSLARWIQDNSIAGEAMPKDLTAAQWASLWAVVMAEGGAKGRPARVRGGRGS